MKLKQIVKVIIACLLFLAIVTISGKIFVPDYTVTTSNNQAFYEAPENSADVMFFGSSSILRGASPLLLYGETGITSWVKASTLQAPHITYLDVQEAFKTQKPKVVFISTLFIFEKYKMDAREANLRIALDYKKLSKEKLAAIRETVANSKEQTFLSYVFPVLRYHSRWDEVLEKGMESRASEFLYAKGQVYFFKARPIKPLTGKIDPTAEKRTPLNSWAADYYIKAIDLCKENGAKVVLLTLPRTSWTQENYQAVKAFAKQNHVDYIDLNLDEALHELDFNFKKDFFDIKHLNIYGSAKATKYLGTYLTKECRMKPSKKDPSILEDYEKGFKKLTKQMKEKRKDWSF